MKKIICLSLILTCLTGFTSVYAQSGTAKQEKTFGLMQHIFKNGKTLTLTYFPIDDMQIYIDQVFKEKIKPDIKTGNKTAKVEVTLTSDEQVNDLLSAVQKEGFQIVVFESKEGDGRCILWRLDPKSFGSKEFKTTNIATPKSE